MQNTAIKKGFGSRIIETSLALRAWRDSRANGLLRRSTMRHRISAIRVSKSLRWLIIALSQRVKTFLEQKLTRLTWTRFTRFEPRAEQQPPRSFPAQLALGLVLAVGAAGRNTRGIAAFERPSLGPTENDQRLGQSSFECERSNLRNFGQISEARCCAGQARALIRKTWSASAKSLSIRSNQTSQRSTKPRCARPVALAARFRGTGRSSHWKTTLHWIGSRPHSSITRVAECGATAIGVRHSWAMWA